MKVTQLARVLSRAAYGTAKIIQARSPEILLASGIMGSIGTCIMACKTTVDVMPVVDEAKEWVSSLEGLSNNKKYIRQTYAKTFKVVAVKYTPCMVLGSLSIASLCCSYGIMRKRNVALTAAYDALQMAFSKYRARIQEEIGEKREKDIFNGISRRDIKILEDGSEVEVKDAAVFNDGCGPYSRFFDEYSTQWRKDPSYNRFFLIMQQNQANDMLKARGSLMLNEVFDLLGMERSAIGATCGWIFDPSRDHLGGDGYVDFGFSEGWRESVKAFNAGYEPSIQLNFNCDGPIYRKLGR